jgi:hypothetical protein
MALEVSHLRGLEQCEARPVDQSGSQPVDAWNARGFRPAGWLGPQPGAHQESNDHFARHGVDRSTVDCEPVVRGDRQPGQQRIERAEQNDALGGVGRGHRAAIEAVLGDDAESCVRTEEQVGTVRPFDDVGRSTRVRPQECAARRGRPARPSRRRRLREWHRTALVYLAGDVLRLVPRY